ncbi:MAG TPA: DUF2059 domain-containing protein [Flavobacterium sp.]|jgi:hypothetical protein|nr:DUF2059 domain-containing protein [Flavobacterium sp.]
MKKTILTLVCLFALQFGFSQTNDALKKEVVKIIELNGSVNQMKLVKKQIIAMIPEKNQAAFALAFDASMPSLYDKMAELYIQTYTKEELDFMLAYYESPIGKQIAAKSEVLAEKSMEAGKEWAEGLQPMMMKYME